MTPYVYAVTYFSTFERVDNNKKPCWLPVNNKRIIMTKLFHIKFHFSWRPVYGLWLAIFLLTFILQLGGWVDVWRYDRLRVEQGDWWLLLTGHLVHLNWPHWALNMAGLGIVAFFFSAYGSVKQWLMVILVSAILIGTGVTVWNTDIRYYVGLSGVLNGMFIFGALCEIRYYPLSGYVLLLGLIGKLLWEHFYGAMPGSEALIGGKVLTSAHLYGAVGGLIVWLGILRSGWLLKK